MHSVVSSLIIGLITGIASGFIVYFLTKKREQNYYIYHHFQDFLFGVIANLGAEIPIDILRNSEKVGGKESSWGRSIYRIYDAIYKGNVEDRKLSQEEKKLLEITTTALAELEVWRKKKNL